LPRHALDVGLDGLALGMGGRDLPAGRGAGFQLVDELVDQRVGVCSGGDQERRRQSGDGLDTAPASVSLVETSLWREQGFSKARREAPKGRFSGH